MTISPERFQNFDRPAIPSKVSLMRQMIWLKNRREFIQLPYLESVDILRLLDTCRGINIAKYQLSRIYSGKRSQNISGVTAMATVFLQEQHVTKKDILRKDLSLGSCRGWQTHIHMCISIYASSYFINRCVVLLLLLSNSFTMYRQKAASPGVWRRL